MVTKDIEKEKILNEIKRKMQFLGTYDSSSPRNIFYDPDLPIDQLKTKNDILSSIVNSHKDPFFRRRLYALQKGIMDPKYEGMINIFKELAVNKKTIRKKAFAIILIFHAKKHEILLEYLLQTFSIIVHLHGDKINEYGKIDLTNIHNIYRKYFRKANMESFLDRVPISFDYREKTDIKCLLQVSNSIATDDNTEDLSIYHKDIFYKNINKLSGVSLEFEAIKHPFFSKYIFGGEEKYYSLSILDYGQFFFTTMFE